MAAPPSSGKTTGGLGSGRVLEKARNPRTVHCRKPPGRERKVSREKKARPVRRERKRDFRPGPIGGGRREKKPVRAWMSAWTGLD